MGALFLAGLTGCPRNQTTLDDRILFGGYDANYHFPGRIDPDRLVAKGYGERVPRTLIKDITREGYTFKAGTVLTDSLINTLPNNDVKEAAHALNRRTEFSILRNDFIPKATPGKAVAPKIEVVVEPEENSITYTLTKDNLYASTSLVNGITMPFLYDPKEKECYMSPPEALRLLTAGAISKEDFEGDVTKIIGEGYIADKAVFHWHEKEAVHPGLFRAIQQVFQSLGLDASRPLVALLPGSRNQEVERLTGHLLGAARILKHRHPELQCILPVAAPHLRPLLHHEAASVSGQTEGEVSDEHAGPTSFRDDRV